MKIDDELIPILEEMEYDFLNERLEVEAVPSGRRSDEQTGRLIRVAVSHNTHWYKKMCEYYPSNRRKKRTARKDGTRVNRMYIEKVLARMIRRKETDSEYGLYILDVAKDRLQTYKELGWGPNLFWKDTGDEEVPF